MVSKRIPSRSALFLNVVCSVRCSASHPGGKQVDGLPPVPVKSNTGAVIASSRPRQRAAIGDFDIKFGSFD